jgi:hypothetical protein
MGGTHLATMDLGAFRQIHGTAASRQHSSFMSSRMLTLTLIMVSVTVGCAPDQAKTPASSSSSDEGACLGYGFVPGTTAYTNCIQREVDARRSGKLGPTYDQRLIAPR